MRAVISLLLLVTALNYATALRCFLCIGSTTSDCARGDVSSMVDLECEPTQATSLKLPHPFNQLLQSSDEPDIVQACVSFISNAEDATTYFERGCVYIYRDVDICSYLEDYIDVVACESCDEDHCNRNPLP